MEWIQTGVWRMKLGISTNYTMSSQHEERPDSYELVHQVYYCQYYFWRNFPQTIPSMTQKWMKLHNFRLCDAPSNISYIFSVLYFNSFIDPFWIVCVCVCEGYDSFWFFSKVFFVGTRLFNSLLWFFIFKTIVVSSV